MTGTETSNLTDYAGHLPNNPQRFVYLDLAVVVGELVGLVLASLENGWGQFVFYTQLSNYFPAGCNDGASVFSAEKGTCAKGGQQA